MHIFIAKLMPTKPRTRPRGGALVVVMLVCMILGALALVFLHQVAGANLETRQYLFKINAEAAVQSAIQHATMLLQQDVNSSPVDGFQDPWVTVPYGKRITSRREWSRYAAHVTDLSGQHAFSLPGPSSDTVVRYRFKLVDRQPKPESTSGYQPRVPAAWHKNAWLPTDDINAVDATSLEDLIRRFDARGTNSSWHTQALAGLVDSRDDNHVLCSSTVDDTEALQFERIVTSVDRRWNHFDDTLRLGRYYEERPNHNFFLVDSARAFYNNQSGRTNIEVVLDREPYLHVDGWKTYKEMRAQSDLPRWYYTMWNGVTAATGSGLPEPQGLFKYQSVVSNTEYALVFDDSKLERFTPKNSIRQTVTFSGWFSSLNEYMHARLPAVTSRGAFVTTAPGAPDCIMLTNMARDARYQITLFTGDRLPKPLTAQVSFFGVDKFEKTSFLTNGTAVLNRGKPVDVKPLHQGDFVEMVIRAPEAGISSRNPFCLESALLEQPEYIVFRNTAGYPVPVKDWRLGYQMGGRLFWSSPFSRARQYTPRHGSTQVNESPAVPNNGLLIITPDSALLDWFIGSRPSGTWGDSSGEHIPVIETGWNNWGPKCPISRAKSVARHNRSSSSNRDFTWETDWKITIPDIDWTAADAIVTNEIVLVDPDGNESGSHPPVAGIVIDQDKDSLTVRLAGTPDRFSFSAKAVLQFRGIPSAVKTYTLVTPSGGIAARFTAPVRGTASSRNCSQIIRDDSGTPIREPFAWSAVKSHLARTKNKNTRTDSMPNCEFPDILEKQKALQRLDISSYSDWFVCDSLKLPFGTARILPESAVRFSRDTTIIKRYEKGWFIWDDHSISLPNGKPGLLSRHVHINGYGPVAIKSFRKGAFSICDTPGVSVTQVLDSTVVIAPSAAGNGLHLFGDSGALVCEWSGISRPEQPVKLTLAAQTAASWDPPVMGSQWMQYTNDLVTISADIWNPRAKKYERLVANKSFDRSDRLYLGEVQPFYFFEGTIRLRLTIHESLSAQQRGLWLKNLYLHPYPVHRYVNVNTAFPSTLLRICGSSRSAASDLLTGSRISNRYTSMREMAPVIRSLQETAAMQDTDLSTRSDIFDLYIVAQVIKYTDTEEQVIAESRHRMILDRSNCRLNPFSRIRIGY